MAEHPHPGGPKRRGWWMFLGFLLIAAYFLLSEHRAHFIQALPYLLLAACVLLHLFHEHGGHGGHSGRGDKEKER